MWITQKDIRNGAIEEKNVHQIAEWHIWQGTDVDEFYTAGI